jgi:Tfp pilus assembly protein PilV
MRRATGSSIVEVMVMMLIISVSIVGIYSMVNNGQKLAALADDRLTGINIAKE